MTSAAEAYRVTTLLKIESVCERQKVFVFWGFFPKCVCVHYYTALETP